MGGWLPREVDAPTPVAKSRRGTKEQAPVAGAEAPATGRSVEGAARAAEASACASETSGSAAAAATGATAASAEPSRKRKRAFSTLR
jgi:hypothetical protein